MSPELRINRWQLPDGVEELLPEAAWRVECLRRRIMDACHAWGFELVMPPLIEYLDSLLTGTGKVMDLQTLKFVDQHNGRTLGIRADITPQVARIDAHALNHDHPNRLFYTGTVLRARTDGFGGSRSPQQFGAELFGHAGPEADIEVIRLMLHTLTLACVEAANVSLDLGHVGVYRGLVEAALLDADQESRLFRALQSGSVPDAQAVIAALPEQTPAVRRLASLPSLRGDASVLARARDTLVDAPPNVHEALDTLQVVVDALAGSHAELSLHIDLGELRGYSYHTGILFATYSSCGQELAHGGRYDHIGEAFGRPRPATGFSGDLKRLADLDASDVLSDGGVFVSDGLSDPGVLEVITRLRHEGERVVSALPGSALTAELARCDRQLSFSDGAWTIVPLDERQSC